MRFFIDAVHAALLNRRDDVDLRELILDDDGALRRGLEAGAAPSSKPSRRGEALRDARRLGEEALAPAGCGRRLLSEVAGEAGKRALVGDGIKHA